MKFKKVEIQAFRAYSNVADGTFDFEVAKNEYADFVSIYAPNGFGKTSFYDAVEWGYTGNIHRFLRKFKFNQEVAKSEKNINSLEQQYILKNRNAIELNGYVKLHTTSSDTPIVNRSIPKPRKGSGDYKFEEKETVRPYFQQVILSQEWIDAFLKEDNGTERYRRFMDYFGDKKLDEYYRCIVSLIKANENNITGLREKLDAMQLELKFEGDTDILSKINEQINAVNQLGDRLPNLKGNTTDNDLVHFTNTLVEKQNKSAFAMQKDEECISYIETVFIGNDSIKGIDNYFQSIVDIKAIEKNEKTQTELLAGFVRKEKREMEMSIVADKLMNSQKVQEQLLKRLELFPRYNEVVNQISLFNEQKASLTSNMKSSEHEKLLLQLSDTDLQVKITAQVKKVQDLTQRLKELPLETDVYAKKQADKNSFLKRKDEVKKEVEKVQEAIEKLVTKKASLDHIIRQLQKAQLAKISSDALLPYASLAAELQKFDLLDKELKAQVKALDKQIEQQNKLISDLRQFVAKGIEMVNSTQASSCPLCTHDYGSYEALAIALSNNEVLPAQMVALLEQKAAVEKQLSELVANKKVGIDKLTKPFSEELAMVKLQLDDANRNLDALTSEEKGLQKKIKELSDDSLKLLSVFGSKEPDLYQDDLRVELTSTEKEFQRLSTEHAESTKKLDAISEEIELLKARLIVAETSLTELANDNAYAVVRLNHRDVFPTEAISEDLYRGKLADLEKEINSFNLELDTLRKEQAELQNKLGNNSRNETEELLTSIQATKTSLQRGIASFEQFLESKLSIRLSEISRAALEKTLNGQRNKIKGNIAKAAKQLEHYSLLLQLKDSVQPYLKFEKAKLDEKEIRKRIKLLKEKVMMELEEEKLKVAAYIDKQIQSFFYEGLINNIYKKIDPHPEYTQIKFICDFSEDKPQLNVSVTNEGRDHFLIPNLYFSTAQLNILSLSIFLAKALNAHDEKGQPLDCIFIDDPIQSMDSINVLSTIDLLRSIVVNEKKQIILSTHDENFHQLLQKKLPPDLFKSKFIELETFGKVKQVTGVA